MCLSEGAYKVVDYGEEKATEILGAILEGFPPGLVSVKRLEWSRPDSDNMQAIVKLPVPLRAYRGLRRAQHTCRQSQENISSQDAVLLCTMIIAHAGRMGLSVDRQQYEQCLDEVYE